MFLYDNKGDYIDVYKLEPKLEEIKKYRKKEMNKIPKDKRCWVATTNDSSLKVLELCDDTVLYEKLHIRYRKYGVDVYHKFYPFNGENNFKYLNEYFNDDEFVYDLHNISMSEQNDMFILCLEKGYKFHRYSTIPYEMEGIINIPQSLYLLELLLQGRTDLIGNNDISKQLSLFDISYIDEIDINVLKSICEYKIVNQSYDFIMKKTDKSKDVIGKVRTLVKK